MRRALARASALLWGLQAAFLNPALALLMVTLYGASAAEAGWALAVYNGSGFLASLALPAYADRRRDYLRPMLGCGVLSLALAGLLISTSSFPIALFGLLALGGPGAVGTTLLFGQLKHSGADPSEVVRTRAVFSAAWVAGPPAASLLIAWSPRAVLLVFAGVAVLNIATTAGLLTAQSAPPDSPVEVDTPPPGSPLPRAGVLVLVAAFIALQAANSAAVSVMNLYVTRTLGLNALWAGVTLAVAAALEVPALLVLGRLGQRHSDLALVAGGCVAGAVYFGAMALVAGPVLLIGLQVLNACFVAVVAGAGLALFQRVVPRPGLAAGLHQNTFRLGAVLSGPVIGVGSATVLGYRTTFLICATLTILALTALVVLARKAGADLSPRPSRP